MQSTKNGFKKHHLIPFSQKKKIKRWLLLPQLQEKNNCLAPSYILCEGKIRFMYSSHMRFYGKQWISSEKGNEHAIG